MSSILKYYFGDNSSVELTSDEIYDKDKEF